MTTSAVHSPIFVVNVHLTKITIDKNKFVVIATGFMCSDKDLSVDA